MKNVNSDMGSEHVPSEEELLKELGIINLSISLFYVVILALFLSLNYIYWEKAILLDKINGTNYSKALPDYTDAPKIAAKLLFFATSVFLGINIDGLNSKLSLSPDEIDEAELKRAESRVISSFLTAIASGLNHNSLNL